MNKIPIKGELILSPGDIVTTVNCNGYRLAIVFQRTTQYPKGTDNDIYYLKLYNQTIFNIHNPDINYLNILSNLSLEELTEKESSSLPRFLCFDIIGTNHNLKDLKNKPGNQA
jgi:hypothetical protein